MSPCLATRGSPWLIRDPLRGTILWKKADVAMNSHLFGDDQYLFLAEANEGGGIGAGRTLRASDGEVLNVPDFSNVYQARIRTRWERQILAAQPGQGNLTVPWLYVDILSSAKDVWASSFQLGSYVLNTEDHQYRRHPRSARQPHRSRSGYRQSACQQQYPPGAHRTARPQAACRALCCFRMGGLFYVALNKPVDGNRVGGGLLHNNFNNGTRCLTVNGWFLAVHRQDGKKTINDREVAWKKGDLAWHSYMPIQNQMLVVDQFDQSPVLLFTTRYNEIMPNGGNRWVSVTQSLSKLNGKMVYDSGPKGINGASPMFAMYQMDLKSRTINLIGYQDSVQHYVDDGKGPPPLPQGAMLPRGGLRRTPPARSTIRELCNRSSIRTQGSVATHHSTDFHSEPGDHSK